MNSQFKEIILFCETPEYHFTIYDLFQFEIVVALILCKIRNYLFSPINMKNFFRKISSTNITSLYSNTERNGQYTGWVEEVVILGSIHDETAG